MAGYLVQRFCGLANWELDKLDSHPDMAKTHLLESNLPIFGAMNEYGVKEEDLTAGFKIALGFLARNLVKEKDIEKLRQEKHGQKLLFFSYMDNIPERQRVILHRILTEGKIVLIDESGRRVNYVLPEWVHLAASGPREHKFSSPFINRFIPLAIPALKNISDSVFCLSRCTRYDIWRGTP